MGKVFNFDPSFLSDSKKRKVVWPLKYFAISVISTFFISDLSNAVLAAGVLIVPTVSEDKIIVQIKLDLGILSKNIETLFEKVDVGYMYGTTMVKKVIRDLGKQHQNNFRKPDFPQ